MVNSVVTFQTVFAKVCEFEILIHLFNKVVVTTAFSLNPFNEYLFIGQFPNKYFIEFVSGVDNH